MRPPACRASTGESGRSPRSHPASPRPWHADAAAPDPLPVPQDKAAFSVSHATADTVSKRAHVDNLYHTGAHRSPVQLSAYRSAPRTHTIPRCAAVGVSAPASVAIWAARGCWWWRSAVRSKRVHSRPMEPSRSPHCSIRTRRSARADSRSRWVALAGSVLWVRVASARALVAWRCQVLMRAVTTVGWNRIVVIQAANALPSRRRGWRRARRVPCPGRGTSAGRPCGRRRGRVRQRSRRRSRRW